MLTQDELDRRRHFVTASDVPAILGKSPWVNAADVFWSKVRGHQQSSNAAIEAGNALEPAVIRWAESELGPIAPGDWRIHDNGLNAASLDGMTSTGEIVEAKTSGITGPGMPHQWGEVGTDEIPDYYYLQVQAQLLVTGAAKAWVPALIGGRGFVMFVVHPHMKLMATIESVSQQFWTEHVAKQLPPSNVFASLETMKKMKREAGKTIAIPDDVAERFMAAREAAKIAKDEEDQAKSELLSAMLDADRATWSGGEFTYFQQTKKSHVVAESTFPVLRPVVNKKAQKVIA